MEVFHTKFYPDLSKRTGGTSSFRQVSLFIKLFSKNSRLLDISFVFKLYLELHENSADDVISDTGSYLHREKNEAALHIRCYFLHFVIKA